MSNITTTTIASNTTTTFPLDYYYSFFVNPLVVVRFYQIGYPITFLLGFMGNMLSLVTFSRLTLRKVSTGCLFIVLAISDTLFLVISVFDFVEFGLQIPFYRHLPYNELCRFRTFISCVSQFLSSWTLVTISVDRWIRARFPYKSGSLCTPKKALIVVGVILLIDVGLYAQVLTPLFGMLLPGFSIIACGPNIFNTSYLVFYLLYWTIVQILVVSLIPATLMILLLIDIYINVQARKKAVIQPNNISHETNKSRQQKTLQRQMFVLMLTSITIFLLTTLPVAIYKILSPRQSNVSSSIIAVASIWVGLGWFQTLNYAVNFYSHCLTSTLFRKEFQSQIRYLLGDKRARANALDLTATVAVRTAFH
ncbi:unnamed protein product [Adineta ricciae]|uniref:G-protein coupled receptors family 1 profile domain-containing protein n=1 Tax=Adineta ricciae TaxID=249248 RepID=A0A814G5Y3_ADIRI|nr:unnamed protein product [Adineta ricciae]CAF1172033.1 unnamed protein product [Adineta ricciae]